MKKFKFRLERILGFKDQIEQQKRLALAGRNEHLKQEKIRLFDLNVTKDKYLAKYHSLFKGKIDINGLRSALSFINKVEGDMALQAKNVVRAEKMVKDAKAEVRDSMRERKIYEKLKERKRKEYELEMGKEEQKEIDEIASRPRKAMAVI